MHSFHWSLKQSTRVELHKIYFFNSEDIFGLQQAKHFCYTDKLINNILMSRNLRIYDKMLAHLAQALYSSVLHILQETREQ